MSNKTRKKPETRAGSRPPVILLVLGGVLLLGAVLWMVFSNRSSGSGSPPQISVDQEKIDFGDVKLGKTVTATFKVTNSGGTPVRFTETPYVEIKEGC